ncbi:hypothetical protein GOODEAATRI_008767 [Goodea atripinnis]|uniref:Uncharacterized protein n=1 Tax=Goodea atripinnis TaxID=208336 RepID=A0ABV0NAG9_9TELE
MDYSQPFSMLNEQLRPRPTSSEQLHSSLCRLENRKLDSLRSTSTSYTTTVLPTEPEPQISITDPGDLEPPQDNTTQNLVYATTEEGLSSDLLPFINSCFNTDFTIKNEDEDEQVNDDGGITQFDDTDSPSELASEEAMDSLKAGQGAGAGESPFQRFYPDKTLPDLINSGRPLGRRRTLTHVSDTVTDEVLSVLRLLHPLIEPESSQPGPRAGENRLDAALVELKNVARQLAISHTKHEDFQRLLQQQVLSQQLAEQQAQNKSIRKGLLRRNKQPPIQRPTNFPFAAPTPPNSNQIFMNTSVNPSPPTPSMPSPPAAAANGTRTWRDKLKKSRPRLGYQDGAEQEKEWGRGDDGFQVVSLD